MNVNRSQGLVAGGAALTLVATILPWLETTSAAEQLASASDGAQSLSGIGVLDLQPLFSGPVAAAVAIVLVGVTVVASGHEWADAVVIVGGGIVALVAALWILAPGTIIGGGMAGTMMAALFSPGIGVYATILGGLLILAGGALSYTNDDDAGSATVAA